MELKTLDPIISNLNIIIIFLALLVILMVFIISMGQEMKKRFNIYLETSVIAFGVLFFFFMVGLFFTTYLFKQNVKKEFDTFLLTKDLEAYIEGNLLNKTETNTLVENLINMYKVGGNRPTDKYWNVTFKSGSKEYNIKLVRAQSDSLLYYLYINGYESLASNDIGTIRTEVLSKFPPEKVSE